MTTADERVEGLQQTLDIVEVKAGGRLVEDEQRRLLLLLADEIGELHTLVFTTREGRGVLTELDIAQSDVLECLQTVDNRLGQLPFTPSLLKKLNRLGDGHVEDIVDVFPTEGYIEDLLLETVSVTSLTFQHEVGHELHLYRDDASALALLTASTFSIEGEILWREAHLLRQGLFGIEVADGIEGFHVGGRIGAARLTDGVLVYEFHMLDGIYVTRESEVFAGGVAHLSDMTLERGIEDAFYKTRLP